MCWYELCGSNSVTVNKLCHSPKILQTLLRSVNQQAEVSCSTVYQERDLSCSEYRVPWRFFGVWNKEAPFSATHEFNQHFRVLLKVLSLSQRETVRSKAAQFFYQCGVFSISLLVSVVWFGMHRSCLVKEKFNYWGKFCHECMWKADTATSCWLALPRQGSKKERKLETERRAEAEGVHITWRIWPKLRK